MDIAHEDSRPGPPVPEPASQPPASRPGPADPAGPAGPADDRDIRHAMLAYLGVPFTGIGVPLVIWLASARRSRFTRGHARQALSVSAAALLYDLCVLIIGLML